MIAQKGCLLDYPYFKEQFKLIAIDLSKQQPLDADRKAIQQINFTGSLDEDGNTTFFIIEEAKETILDLFTRNCESVVILFYCNIISI